MSDDVQHMTCMEVWGGNQPVDNNVVLAGLDAWVYSRPFEQAAAGGDVHYVSSCATGRITRLLLADVSGHGEMVAQTAVSLRRLMQRYVNYIDQTAFVRAMNGQFAQLAEAGTFATAIVSTFFGPTNDLTLCIAGHPPPLMYRPAAKQWSVLGQESGRATNIPLGIEDVVDWAQFGVRLAVGDLVLCYTDSLIESFGADGQMLGVDGLLAAARSIDVSDSQRIIPRLLEAIASQAKGNLENDDVTVLLFEPNGKAPTVPLRDRVCAPLRVIKGVLRSLLPGGSPAPWPEASVANLGGAVFSSLNRLWSKRNGRAGADLK